MKPHSATIQTRFGSFTVVWTRREESVVVQAFLSKPGAPSEAWASQLYPRSTQSSNPFIDRLMSDLERYFRGEEISFSLDNVDLGRCSPFQRRVLLAEHGIPRGYVSTYGRIAEHLGAPGAARAVGRALATNPFPIIVPCHRAVRSDGAVGGYQGGLEMKRALLEMEGVELINGRSSMRRVYY